MRGQAHECAATPPVLDMKTLHRTKGLKHDLVVTRKGQTITLWSSAGIRHTVLNLDAPHLPGLEYARNTLAALAFSPGARSFLILGLGGGSIPRMLFAARPCVTIDTVEIDPAVPELARRFFQVEAWPRFKVYLQDAAAFLEQCTARYDVIVVDTYVGEQFPEHCSTREFLGRARACLEDGGVVVVNWMSGNPGLFQRLLGNLDAVIGPVWRLAGSKSKNALLFSTPRVMTRRELTTAAGSVEREIPFECFLGRLVQRLKPLPVAASRAVKRMC